MSDRKLFALLVGFVVLAVAAGAAGAWWGAYQRRILTIDVSKAEWVVVVRHSTSSDPNEYAPSDRWQDNHQWYNARMEDGVLYEEVALKEKMPDGLEHRMWIELASGAIKSSQGFLGDVKTAPLSDAAELYAAFLKQAGISWNGVTLRIKLDTLRAKNREYGISAGVGDRGMYRYELHYSPDSPFGPGEREDFTLRQRDPYSESDKPVDWKTSRTSMQFFDVKRTPDSMEAFGGIWPYYADIGIGLPESTPTPTVLGWWVIADKDGVFGRVKQDAGNRRTRVHTAMTAEELTFYRGIGDATVESVRQAFGISTIRLKP